MWTIRWTAIDGESGYLRSFPDRKSAERYASEYASSVASERLESARDASETWWTAYKPDGYSERVTVRETSAV